MKITIFELLGMVKDGKLMPERIKFENYIYIWRNTQKDYFCEQINHSLEDIIGGYLFNNLFLEVEIIEEEKKIPEKLEEFDIQGLEVSGYSMTQAEYLLEDGVKENRKMINWILDYLKSKGE